MRELRELAESDDDARARAAPPRGQDRPPRPRALREPHAVAEGPALAPPEPPLHARLHRAPLHRLRRAPRRPPLRRRRGHRRGLGALPRPQRRRRRPPEGPRDEGERQAQLRAGAPRGLPQGAPHVRARRPLRPAHPHVHRHARRLPGHRRRGARPERGDRRVPRGDGARARADRRDDHRRGRQRRRARARRREPRARPRVRDVQRHLARRVARRSSGRTARKADEPPPRR